ncbi:MAG: hypothetical protein H7248_00325 [Microbacteriaceae bacterium]|nr:hypothetical protein [Microbacteriaceae bacterium]
MFKTTTAAISLVIVALLAVPTAAFATDYVPAQNVTTSGPVVAGAPVDVAFAPGSFAGDESVRFVVVGDGPEAQLAVLKARSTASLTKQAHGGAVTIKVTIPVGATGTYTTTATGVTSGRVATAALAVAPVDSAASTGGKALDSTGGKALASTGVSPITMLLMWAAGGVLLLGIALLIVRVAVRRQRAAA